MPGTLRGGSARNGDRLGDDPGAAWDGSCHAWGPSCQAIGWIRLVVPPSVAPAK